MYQNVHARPKTERNLIIFNIIFPFLLQIPIEYRRIYTEKRQRQR